MGDCGAGSSPVTESQGTSWTKRDVTASPGLVLDPSNLVLQTCGFALVQILILSNLSLAEKASAEASEAVCCLNDISACLCNTGWRSTCRPKEDLWDFTLWKILRQTVDEGSGHKSDPLRPTKDTLENVPTASLVL